ncbi:pilus assembly protein TadG-related protein [Clostridiaceae bacterium HSG29]|nr:pilus assembly protein TadG-related protein [Clostridiaceae bacterium HSG29]
MIKIIENDNGSIAVIFVIVLGLLLGAVGMVVDYGYSVVKDIELTNALDAAALAGAQDLDDVNKTTATVNEYLVKNGIDPNTVSITFSDNNKSLKLQSTKSVQNRFMKYFNIDTSEIRASVKVSINPVSKINGGAKPFGVPYKFYDYGEEVVLKEGASDGDNGNFGPLALGGTGAAVFLNNALTGYSGPLEVGDEILTEPGNMAMVINPLKQLLQDDYSTFNNFSEDSPRLWLIPMIWEDDIVGRDELTIAGFAMFYVEDIGKQTGKTVLTGRFVKNVISGEQSEIQTDYGVYVAKLVE